MGDFNLDWQSSASSYLKEVSGNLGLSQLVREPTRPNPKNVSKSSLIDLIFSNRSDKISACGVFPQGISDHCPIACIRDSHLVKNKTLTVLRRSFKSFNEQAFVEDLVTSNSHLNLESTDVQVALDSFVSSFNTIANKHAPLKRIHIKNRVTPWFSQELSSLFNDRNVAWSRARRTGDPQLWSSFRQIRNKCTSAVRKAKSNYYLELVSSSYSNPAKFWKAVNLNKNKTSNVLPQCLTVGDCVVRS